MFDLATIHPLQPKSVIGHPNDRYEQEADAVTHEVMRIPASQIPTVQRKCTDCEEEELQMKPLEMPMTPIVQKHPQEEEEQWQMKSIESEVIQRAPDHPLQSDTASMHQDLVEQYAEETGMPAQAGAQYSEGYATWLQTREANMLNTLGSNNEAYQRTVQNWPVDSPIWPRLRTREARIEFIRFLLSTDFTNCRPYSASMPGQEAGCENFSRNQETFNNVCQGFATQLHLRFRSQAAAPEQEEINRLQTHARIYFQAIETRYRIPIQIATVPGHAFNVIRIGPNPSDINSYLFIEPQNDRVFEPSDQQFGSYFRRGIINISDATEYNERNQYMEDTQRTFVRNAQGLPQSVQLSLSERMSFQRMYAAIFIADDGPDTWRATITDENITYEEHVHRSLDSIPDDHVVRAAEFLIGQNFRRQPNGPQEQLTRATYLWLLHKTHLLDRLLERE